MIMLTFFGKKYVISETLKNKRKTNIIITKVKIIGHNKLVYIIVESVRFGSDRGGVLKNSPYNNRVGCFKFPKF